MLVSVRNIPLCLKVQAVPLNCNKYNIYCASEEDIEKGLSIEENVGLRLKALEYWRCFETCLYDPTSDTSLKLVLAEPISTISESAVQFAGQLRGYQR